MSATITDGDVGDDDLTADSVIVDQGGPGVPGAVAVPALSIWGLILLALSMAGLAFAAPGLSRRLPA